MAETTERGMGKTLRDIEQDYIRMLAETEPPQLSRSEAMRKSHQERKHQSSNYTITTKDKKKRGTDNRYRIAKLKRDHPAIAERLAAGEFASVSAAERAAGKPVPKRYPKDPQKLIAQVRQEYGDAYLAAVRQALGD